MHKYLLPVLIFGSAILSAAFVFKPASTIHNQLSAAEKKGGWILLFDGKSTKGWHNYGTTTVGERWKIEDGALYLDVSDKEKNGVQLKGGGNLISDGEYENYELRLEWKIAKCANSGIIYNLQENPGKYSQPWMTGPEMQILDNDCHPDAKIEKHRSGDLYDLITGTPQTVKPVGEWNKIRLICKGDYVEHWQNGKKILSTTMGTPAWDEMLKNSKWKNYPDFGKFRKGKIGLQDHGDGVWFRNIKLKKL